MRKIKGQDRLVKNIVLFLFLSQAGMPFFTGDINLAIDAGLTLFIFIATGKRFQFFFLKLLFAFVILMMAHVVLFQKFQIGPFAGFLVRLTYAFCAVRVIGQDFPKYYVQMMYMFTVLSLFLWAIFAFVPGTYNVAMNIASSFVEPLELYAHNRNNLIIYTLGGTWLQQMPPRNAGPFWEPGAFGVFLVLAVLFNTMLSKNLFDKKNLVFFAAIITTFSLGTYTSTFLLIMVYFTFVKKVVKGFAIVPMVAIGILAVYSFYEFDFLGEKLFERERFADQQLKEDVTYENLDYLVGRNEQSRLDMRDFQKSPIVGTGLFQGYEFGFSASGVTFVLRTWGILGTLLLFGTMYYSFKRYVQYRNLEKSYALLALVTLIAIAISQSLYGKPFFLGMTFIFLVNLKMVRKVANPPLDNLHQRGKTNQIQPGT